MGMGERWVPQKQLQRKPGAPAENLRGPRQESVRSVWDCLRGTGRRGQLGSRWQYGNWPGHMEHQGADRGQLTSCVNP